MTKRYDALVALLTLTDIIIIVAMYPLLPPRAIENLVVYNFDAFVVTVMALSFYARMKRSQQGKKIFFLNNWYEIPAMIPIVVFAAARSFTIYDDIIVVGIMFRAIGVLYTLRFLEVIKHYKYSLISFLL